VCVLPKEASLFLFIDQERGLHLIGGDWTWHGVGPTPHLWKHVQDDVVACTVCTGYPTYAQGVSVAKS
jgi:hypothetical protein